MLGSLLWLWTATLVPAVQASLAEPLIFDFVASEPGRVKVFWDPSIGVAKVLELSNRDVGLARDNETEALSEEFGDWHILVTERDADEGDRRYVFLKKSLCHEVDWRVAWEDAAGRRYGPVTQRLGASPSAWAPQARLTVSSKSYDPVADQLSVGVEVAVEDEALEGSVASGAVRVHAALKSCEALFRRPVPVPVSSQGRVLVSGEYARKFCSLSLHLAVDAVSEDEPCRQLRLSPELAVVDLYCGDVEGLECGGTGEPDAKATACEMDCQADVFGVPKYEYDEFDVPNPYVEVKWIPRIADRPVQGFVVRHVQIDRHFANYPMKEFNVTVERLGPDELSAPFQQYTRDAEAAYGVQACVLYNDCKVGLEPDWDLVPQRRVPFNDLIAGLPEPTTLPPPTFPPTLAPTPPPPTADEGEDNSVLEEGLVDPVEGLLSNGSAPLDIAPPPETPAGPPEVSAEPEPSGPAEPEPSAPTDEELQELQAAPQGQSGGQRLPEASAAARLASSPLPLLLLLPLLRLLR